MMEFPGNFFNYNPFLTISDLLSHFLFVPPFLSDCVSVGCARKSFGNLLVLIEKQRDKRPIETFANCLQP